MIKLYDEYIVERLGVNDDVIKLTDFLIDHIVENKSYIFKTDKLPKLSFKINKLFIDFGKVNSFNSSKSKHTKNGFNIYIQLNSFEDFFSWKEILSHELTHVLKYTKLTLKKQKLLSHDFTYSDERFNKLISLIYSSDESEINANVSQIYYKYKDIENIEKFDLKMKNFKELIKQDEYMKISNQMINYDIKNDLKNISEKDIYYFFKHISNKKRMRKSKNKIKDFFKIIYNIINDRQNEIDYDVSSVLHQTQKYINSQGEKLKRNLYRLYDLY